MQYTRLPDQSAEYVARREELRQAEVELMRHRERVAELRRPRDLDAGDKPLTTVRLSELFSGSHRALVIYQFMYGKLQTSPCPMCTMWIDGFNGVARHVEQNVDFVVAAAADPATLRQHARNRGWRNLRLLSCGDSTFKFDLDSEDADGNQDSTISVFTRDENGAIRHFYSAHPRMAEDIDERGIDLLSPVWNLMDLTPEGRGDWYAELDYSAAGRAASAR